MGEPSVLILDDTLSALDALTAQRVQHHLLTLTDTTIIMISQRLALMQEADWIMTMKHGKIIDQNKPEILETTSSFYQEIKQSKQKEEMRHETISVKTFFYFKRATCSLSSPTFVTIFFGIISGTATVLMTYYIGLSIDALSLPNSSQPFSQALQRFLLCLLPATTTQWLLMRLANKISYQSVTTLRKRGG